ncbi:hypothetical protein EHS13_09115 [Paenibacillus psychroresistens]|uniref:Golvesin/Xly CBD-like domain-containing protein n=1 Tax=Paenibacillus psychroresistens TaxID=1778678 RepID=A0A6B8RHK2_9BACL|nr:right-handed parallel beta-helix repeat-containing protein [Paenibacillus psychroresistens]QGQ95032.1 hypothetical protein EHS13_09115 [Paenibacillus psychroresistens]
MSVWFRKISLFLVISICLSVLPAVPGAGIAAAAEDLRPTVIMDASLNPNASPNATGYYEYPQGTSNSWYTSTNVTAVPSYNNTFTRYGVGSSVYATWRPNLEEGKYKVYIWKPVHTSSSTNAKISVFHQNGMTPITMNQTMGVAGWEAVGVFRFSAGTSNLVKLSGSGGFLRTSAVKFEPSNEAISQEHGSSNMQAVTNVVYTQSLYVSPNGNDANPGTLLEPLLTINEARDVIRTVKQTNDGVLPTGGVQIYFRGGTYRVLDTLEFNYWDSGTSDSPVTYQAYAGEAVQFTGGYSIPSSQFAAVTNPDILDALPLESRADVLVADLAQLGITNYDVLAPLNQKVPPELFFNGSPMTLSRWPNASYALTGNVEDPGTRYDDGNTPRGFTFEYTSGNPLRWTKSNDIWLAGYWMYDWDITFVPLDSIDATKGTIKTKKPSYYAVKKGQRYYAYNVLEETDQPGEWYLDRSDGKLYMLPPAAMTGADIQMSLFNKPLMMLSEASHLTFKGITFENSRSNGIMVNGGVEDHFEGLTVRNFGLDGINITGGTHHSVLGSDVHNTGSNGIYLDAGNKQTLEPANHRIDNNVIYEFGRIAKTNKSGVQVRGVGNEVTHNRIYDGPHQGIIFDGNDHLVSYNEIFAVNREVEDAGAIYSFLDLAGRGTEVSYNYIHDVTGIPGPSGVWGIYLDGGYSGVNVIGNVIRNVTHGIFSNGGRDNIMKNNLLINTNQSSIFVQNHGFAKSYDPNDPLSLVYKLMTVPYAGPVYAKYPHLANILQDEVEKPKYVKAMNNVIVNGAAIYVHDYALPSGVFAPNYSTAIDPGFINPSADNYGLKEDSVVFDQLPDFEPILFDQIGLYTDSVRPTIPPKNVQMFGGVTLYPAENDADPNGLKLSWDPAVGSKQFRIVVAKDAEFLQIVKDSVTTLPYAIIEGLEYGQTYYWKVEAEPLVASYGTQWNVGGSQIFNTLLAKDKLEHQIALAEALHYYAVEGTEGGQYAGGAKAGLVDAIDAAELQLNSSGPYDGSLEDLTEAIDSFHTARVSSGTIHTAVADDYNGVTIGTQPPYVNAAGTTTAKYTVVADPDNPTNRVAELNDDTATGSMVVKRPFLPAELSMNVSFRVRLEKTNTLMKVFFRTGLYTDPLKISFMPDGYLDINNGQYRTPYASDTWYEIKANLNFQTRKYDFYIDGLPVITQGNLLSLPDFDVPDYLQLDQIGIATRNSSLADDLYIGKYYFDDFKITYPEKERDNAYLKDLSIDGEKLEAFTPDQTTYDVALPADSAFSPITATVADSLYGLLHISAATGIPGKAILTVLPQNRRNAMQYSINFISATSDKTSPTASVAFSSTATTSDSVTATITPSEPVTITNNGGANSYTFLFNGSFTFDFVDAAGNLGSATATVSNITNKSTGAPGKPVLSDDNGYDTGILDGNYKVKMDMWWGNNGKLYKLFENDKLIDTQILTDNSPNAESTIISVTYKKNGTYRYYGELTNAFGTTRSDVLTVNVTQATPAKLVLSNDNWDGDGSFKVSMNLWWGTNGTTYRLYENGVLIDSQALTDQTPQAQSTVTIIHNKTPGVYEYRGELVNYAGTVSSETMNVTVTQ